MFRIVSWWIFFIFLWQSTFAQEKKFVFTQNKMGSPFNLVLVTTDSLEAINAASKCFRLIDSFNLIFSDYDSLSELSTLHKKAGSNPLSVSPAMVELLILSLLQKWSYF